MKYFISVNKITLTFGLLFSTIVVSLATYAEEKMTPLKKLGFNLIFGALFFTSVIAEGSTVSLTLEIKDKHTGESTPARLEIRGSDGEYYIAGDAVPIGGDCTMSDFPKLLIDEVASVEFADRLSFRNPYTKTQQFYSSGVSSVKIPSGSAFIKAYKGPEYKVTKLEVDLSENTSQNLVVNLERWVNMPESGWFSGDDHLHIARPTADFNPIVSKMMQAEDIHVANLLQMGKVEDFTIAQQYTHGPDSYYQEGNHILVSGQENPRTHFLGHTITLGAEKTHFDADQYLIYRSIWEKTIKEGAINGFAHAIFPYGSFLAPHDGLAVVLPHDLLHFLEVLQFDRTGYDVWYDLLALGYRITPTAGTDYPCGGQLIPGHERFYTKVEGAFTYPKWIASVRKGRTVVTTGPMVDFKVNGYEAGDEIILIDKSKVDIVGTVTFDPSRDDLSFIELLQNGRVIERFSRIAGAAKIEFEVEKYIDETSWFALRGYGNRIDENALADPVIFGTFEPTSLVHSGPVYVSLKNQPGLRESARAREVAREFLARLMDLKRVLSEDNLDYLGDKLELPDIDAVPKYILAKNRDGLLKEIDTSIEFFKTFVKP